MWFRSLFNGSKVPSTRRPARRKPRPAERRQEARKLLLESLEDRCLLAFNPLASYDVGNNPQTLATGDFNGDGQTDLVAANYGDSTVSVLLGNADGSFQPALTSPTGAGPQSLAVGDFDGDGQLDLATASVSGVSILKGDGLGSFAAPSSIGIGSSPSSAAVGDFNGDGNMDLAVGSHTSYYIPPWGGCGYYGCYGGGGYWVDQPDVRVLMGSGDGSFAAPNVYQLWGSGSTTALAVADFNGDGLDDLASAGSEYGVGVQVLLGAGSGTLGTPIYSNGPLAWTLAAADVNADGNSDLVTANVVSGSVSVLLGTGLGSFGYESARIYSVGASARSAAVADVNGDGRADIVTANFDGSVSVLLGTGLAAGASAFRPPVIVAGADSFLDALAIGEFNGDGRSDVAATTPTANSVAVLLNDGTWPALDAPSLRINDVSVTEGNAGTVDATFTVTLSAASSQDVTVHYSTGDYDWNSATAGSDYEAQSGELTIPAGQTSATINVPVYGDRVGEFTEHFAVNLTDPASAFIADGLGLGTILDDEPRITIDYSASAVEGNTGTTPMDFKVRLSTASDTEVRVNFSTAEGDTDYWYWGWYYGYGGATSGSDFEPESGTLIFDPGEIEKTISVLVHGDRIAEPTEFFIVELSDPIGADIDYGQGAGLIYDDEPYVNISGTTVIEGNGGTTEAVFTVTLSAASDGPITVEYTTLDYGATAGEDYQAAARTLTFDPNATSQTIAVLVNGDAIAEYTERFAVQLTAASGAHLGSGWATATIEDDDAHLSINDVSLQEGDSGVTYFVFTVSLSAASDSVVTVDYETFTFWDWHAQPGSDYQAQSGTLVFAAGETSKTISIAVYGDTRKEEDEYFWISLSNVTGNAVIYGDYQGMGTILNDDAGTGGGGGGGGNGHGKGGKKK